MRINPEMPTKRQLWKGLLALGCVAISLGVIYVLLSLFKFADEHDDGSGRLSLIAWLISLGVVWGLGLFRPRLKRFFEGVPPEDRTGR